MSFPSNAHTHTTYCDGKATAAEMTEAARQLGFQSLGFSGHAAQGFDDAYSMMGGRQGKYRRELRQMQKEAKSNDSTPRLWVGVELDALADEKWKRDAYRHFDYVIGSAHYLCRDYGGRCVGVDGEPELLRCYVDEVFSGDALQMARTYYELQVRALIADQPDIIGHFDLVRKYAKKLSLFDEDGMAYRLLALNALESAFACGGVLEINTGGMARGYLDTPFPTRELLGAWRELGGQITITSDCHDPALLQYGFDAAAELAKSVGYAHARMLGTKDELWEEIAL